jgi:hypothetical protein
MQSIYEHWDDEHVECGWFTPGAWTRVVSWLSWVTSIVANKKVALSALG